MRFHRADCNDPTVLTFSLIQACQQSMDKLETYDIGTADSAVFIEEDIDFLYLSYNSTDNMR